MPLDFDLSLFCVATDSRKLRSYDGGNLRHIGRPLGDDGQSPMAARNADDDDEVLDDDRDELLHRLLRLNFNNHDGDQPRHPSRDSLGRDDGEEDDDDDDVSIPVRKRFYVPSLGCGSSSTGYGSGGRHRLLRLRRNPLTNSYKSTLTRRRLSKRSLPLSRTPDVSPMHPAFTAPRQSVEDDVDEGLQGGVAQRNQDNEKEERAQGEHPWNRLGNIE